MPSSSSPSSPPTTSKDSAVSVWINFIPSLSEDPTHPAQISLRTYALALCLSLGPSVVPLLTSPLFSSKVPTKSFLSSLKRILARELHVTGFAFSLTLAVGGGAAITALWDALDSQNKDQFDHIPIPRRLVKVSSRLSAIQKAFISNIISSSCGLILLQNGRLRAQRLRHTSRLKMPSPTLELTLLLLVRAIDVFTQTFVFKRSAKMYSQPSLGASKRHEEEHRHLSVPDLSLVRERLEKEKELKELKDMDRRRAKLRTRIDAVVFWACSARIMWCFVYEPHRLPPSYVKWISALASVDSRLLEVLRLIRSGEWSYTSGSVYHRNLVMGLSQKLGYPPSWGDPVALPAVGGPSATAVWKTLGVTGRDGIAGLPCEVVHGRVGSSIGIETSCTANSGLRGLRAFVEAVAIYLPAHFLPILFTRPRVLLRPKRFIATVLASLRSASFLSTFVASFWYGICLTRTFGLARAFSSVPHDFWDGPYGCSLVACVLCGSSIWIEDGKRRGEMALYVLPRAVRAFLPHRWLRSENRGVVLTERLAFVLSMASLLTAATHRPDSLRGLSRWTLAFVMKGPNAGFWKRKFDPNSIPVTPTIPSQTPTFASDLLHGRTRPATPSIL